MEEQQYGMGDLRQYIDGRPLFPTISPSPPPDLLSCHRGFNSPHPYDMLIFRSDSSTAIAPPSDGFEAEAGGLIVGGGGDGGAGRWPRQETLTLLEIRSRLDPKFKEANHKGPLWDEVSRIMSQEHGYQRSGKKCREKFENLYKYYKKTKEGKSGRQDGKHYRFFRQLEALYGDATTTAAHFHGGGNFQYNFPNSSSDNQEPYPGSKISDASHVSVPDSCDYDTTTSSYCSDSNVVVGAADAAGVDDARMKKRRGKKSLKTKIEASIDAQMRSMMEKQQVWMEKMATLVEAKERERLLREEQWRRQDAARIDGEQKMWAAERAWVGARDAALMTAFSKLAGKELEPHPSPPPGEGSVVWPEREVARLIQLRSGMELRFQENGMASEESVWDEIAGKMAASACGDGGGGVGRSGSMCRDVISDYLIKCSKKRKENAKGFTYYHQNRDPISDHGVAGVDGAMRLHGGGNSPRNGGAGGAVNDGVFRYFVGDSFQRL